MSRLGRIVASLLFLSLLVVLLSIFGLIDFTTSIKSLACTKDVDCPFITDRPCVRTFCNKAVHRCEEATVFGGECSLDEQCVGLYDSKFACNATTCSCYKPPQCLFDDDCPESDFNCQSFYCINNTCIQNTTDGAQCSIDEQCVGIYNDPLYLCNTSATACSCYKRPQCLVDGDCPITLKSCAAFYCLDETCALQTNVSAGCSNNAECVQEFGQYYQCNLSSCQCIFAPPLQINFTCTSDANCGNSTNPCQTFKCTNGNCNQVLNPGALCALDGMCVIDNDDPFYACNLTSCQCYRRPLCTQNSDCQQIYNRSCVEAVCFEGHCFEETTSGDECSLDEQCSASHAYNTNWKCNTSACSCYYAPQCFSNSDCASISASALPCTNYTCQAGTCVLGLNAGAECAVDGTCHSGHNSSFACNTTSCQCQFRPFCTVDAQCQAISNRSCVSARCVSGQCIENLATNATCSMDEQCAVANGGNTRYKCNTTSTSCSCYLAPQCITSADCYSMNPNVSACSNFTCQAGICVLGLNTNASCSSDEYCIRTFNDPFYACNATACQCYRKPECITNADCPYNYALPCSNFTCQNNRCTLTLNPGANCSTDAQCVAQYGFGYACNITVGPDVCGCYKKPQCVATADCPVNVDQCAYVPCINGTCTQTKAPGSTCINTADCVTLFNSSLYVCNQTSCQCTVSPFAPGYGIAFVQGNATSTGDPITKFTMGHSQTGITEADWLFLGNWSGGVRVANALSAGPQLWGVTFTNDTFTVTQAGVWQIAIQVQGAKPTGASQIRNWMLTASKNSNTTTYNQSILPRPFSSVIGFTTNNQILTTVGVTSFSAVPGDTFRIFCMETLPSGGALSDIDVYNFWVLVQKFPV